MKFIISYRHIINKINAKNKNPIIIKLYENISEYSAYRFERYLINEIGRRDLNLGSLANLTNGGEGGSGTKYTREKRNNMISNKRGILKYDNNGIILEIFENIVDLSIKYPYLLTNKIHRACKSFGGRRVENCFWKYSDGELIGDIIEVKDVYRPVLQYDLDGNFVGEWNYASEIPKFLNISGNAILKCCRNNMKQQLSYKFKNFMWFFKSGEIATQINPHNKNSAQGNDKITKRDIMMYNINDELIGRYCPRELKNMGFKTKTIYGCCNNKFKISQGFKWKWA